MEEKFNLCEARNETPRLHPSVLATVRFFPEWNSYRDVKIEHPIRMTVD